MSKRMMMTLAAVLCCTMTSMVAIAQNNVDEAMKLVEQKVKLADENPTDGKLQYQAEMALVGDDLGDKVDIDRSMTYANRALKIAEAQTVLKDTLKGATYTLLGGLYMAKGDFDKTLDYYEKGLVAYEQELGRYDPWTITQRLIRGYFIMNKFDARRGSLMIQQAFLDSEMAPEDMRIKNIPELTSLYEMAVEVLMADMSNRTQRCLPLILFDGKLYLMLETGSWNIEEPLVGWLTPSLMDILKGKKDEEQESDIILLEYMDTNAAPRLVKADDTNKPEFKVAFSMNLSDPHSLLISDESCRLMFFEENVFNQILDRYHAFKATLGK